MERIYSFTDNKKTFLRYLQRGHRRQKKLQWWKAAKVARSPSHCSKAGARERKKNRYVKFQKLNMDKRKSAIERSTQLVPKKQFDWLYSFAITCMHSNCSGNLQGNRGMAFGRAFKTNKSFYLFLGWSSSFEGSPLRMLACFFL